MGIADFDLDVAELMHPDGAGAALTFIDFFCFIPFCKTDFFKLLPISFSPFRENNRTIPHQRHKIKITVRMKSYKSAAVWGKMDLD
jgi:hypothetical protein